MPHAHGTFEVQLTPRAPDAGVNDAVPARLSLDKQFHGDLEAASHGQADKAGTPTRGTNIRATRPEPIDINVVVESGSSPILIRAFQPA